MVQSEIIREQHDHKGVQVIARAADILRTLKGHSQGLSLAQIAKEVGLARSTVHRLVSALEAEQFVSTASPNGRVRLGLGLAPLAAWVNSELRYLLHPFLESLSREVDETVDLAVLDQNLVFFVDQVAVPHRLQAASSIGATFPLHCTANGKAFLAEMPIEQIERLIPESLQVFTTRTITTREHLLAELAHIRINHIAYDREEHTEGICAVGATIRDIMGNPAAITIPVPSIRFYNNEQRLSTALLRTCERIKKSFDAL